ncbi:hypothetical protein [Clostridium saccharobutylicum]|uniref:DUF3953 domain-containing protein n=1 Tax=Clostridium saccharobutylicum TaxID=169679 RepID=A0A1S8NGN6_CLOSA|nr:hypothetical protein [Clostridium saccharobutylicum]AQR89568.1 hypothetical protein CLOSC_12710 [Clostridium saccharobutylicum]AQR99470.1 hypothetical protein CSACC_12790 [Clostridium saccharobutylicum]AQS09202.1 hypothetical protein CLOBY_13250 [Clostridium saccharobutylicum]AQS13456.1 hypothetical protein CLOSACC_12790 [Clostridium saccharobutylicum]MBA2904354.1 hypothetical protein [Clostridium saccharobutylicum]
MIKKTFYIINFILAITLPILSLNLIESNSNPNDCFPFIFICLGLCNTFLGINLLNDNKKLLSISSFMLAGFFFILVGSKIYIYG